MDGEMEIFHTCLRFKDLSKVWSSQMHHNEVSETFLNKT